MYLQSKCSGFKILLLILLSFTESCSFAQSKATDNFFIKVYKALSCPVVPFASIETEISNYMICNRNVLPPRWNMSKEHLDCYDSWDTKPKYTKIDSVDYDSMKNFILTSGVIELNQDYVKPVSTGGMICMKSGACSIKYVIETSEKRIELPISGAFDFTLPKSLSDLNDLFNRIIEKYK
jgi:hypothetical protein